MRACALVATMFAALPALAAAQEPGSLRCTLANQCTSINGCTTEALPGMSITLGTDGGELSLENEILPLLPTANRPGTGYSWVIEPEDQSVIGLFTLSTTGAMALSLQIMSHEPPVAQSWTGSCTRSKT